MTPANLYLFVIKTITNLEKSNSMVFHPSNYLKEALGEKEEGKWELRKTERESDKEFFR